MNNPCAQVRCEITASSAGRMKEVEGGKDGVVYGVEATLLLVNVQDDSIVNRQSNE